MVALREDENERPSLTQVRRTFSTAPASSSDKPCPFECGAPTGCQRWGWWYIEIDVQFRQRRIHFAWRIQIDVEIAWNRDRCFMHKPGLLHLFGDKAVTTVSSGGGTQILQRGRQGVVGSFFSAGNGQLLDLVECVFPQALGQFMLRCCLQAFGMCGQ